MTFSTDSSSTSDAETKSDSVQRWTRRRWLSTCTGLIGSSCLSSTVFAGQDFASGTASAAPVTALCVHRNEVLAAQGSWLWLLDARTLEVRSRWSLPMAKCLRMIVNAFREDDQQDDSIFLVGGEPGERGICLQLEWPSADQTELEWIDRIETEGDVFNDLALDLDGAKWIATRDQRVLRFAKDTIEESLPAIDDRAHSGSVTRVCVLEVGDVVSASRDQSLRVRRGESGDLIRELHQHIGGVIDLVHLPAAGRLPQVASLGLDRTLRVWQPTIGRMVRFVRLPETPVACAVIDSSMTLLVIGEEGNVYEVDALRASIVAQASLDQPAAYCISADSRFVGGWNGSIGRLKGIETEIAIRLPPP